MNDEDQQAQLKNRFREAGEARKTNGGDVVSLFGVLKAATPAGGPDVVSDGEKLGRLFWGCGHLDVDSDLGSLEINKANPLFGSPEEAVPLHYALDPLQGFHLAGAYLPVEGALTTGRDRLERLVHTAKKEFGMWCDAFRTAAAAGRVKLRFFSGDALLFAHTLQHRAVTGSSRSAGWYRTRHEGAKPLVLEEGQYGREGIALVKFNVIDTSNLVDHLRALNLLAATSPLLSEESAGATLYTETLTRPPDSREPLEDILGNDPATVSLLLGLVPVEFVTNTSPSPVGDEQAVELLTTSPNNKQTNNQANMHTRISWKRPLAQSGRPGLEPLHIAPDELAIVLHRIYLQLYPAENLLALFANMTLADLQDISLPNYTRAGFAAVLKVIRGRVVTDWDQAMGLLLELVESKGAMMNTHYLQELYLYMHLLGVHSVDTYTNFADFRMGAIATAKGDNKNNNWKRFLAWKNMPPSVAITLKVPRSALSTLSQADAKTIGTVPVHGVLRIPVDQLIGGWQNFFPAVQLSFGTFSTSGTPFTNAFRVSIREDPAGWGGTSPLLVSFRVPSWSLFIDSDNPPLAGFAIQSTPVTSAAFVHKLGFELSIFRAAVTDSDAVFITPDLPNQTGGVIVPGFASRSLVSSASADDPRFKLTITAHAGEKPELSGLSARLDIRTTALKAALLTGSAVSITVNDPCHVAITVGIAAPMKVQFPFAVDKGIKVRIARTSAYIELVAAMVLDPCEHPHKAFTAPLVAPVEGSQNRSPVCWTLPYVSFSSATPALSLGTYNTTTNEAPSPLTFLTTHLARQFTPFEYRLLIHPRAFWPIFSSPAQQARLAFKDTLRNIFLHATDLEPGAPRTQNGTPPKTLVIENPIAALARALPKSKSRMYILRPSPSHSSSSSSSSDESISSYLQNQRPGHDDVGSVGTGLRIGDIVLFLSRLHWDVARRTVVWDAAVVVVSTATGEALRDNIPQEAPPRVCLFLLRSDEAAVWRGVLPAWAERCRSSSLASPSSSPSASASSSSSSWDHRANCAYRNAGPNDTWQAPVSWDRDGDILCDCGKGVFPDNWAHDDLPLPLWAGLKQHAVRVAIVPVFASALAGPMEIERNEVRVQTGAWDGERECQGCGSWVAREGGGLKACGKCKGVKYCGRACQRGDWKRHKGECRT